MELLFVGRLRAKEFICSLANYGHIRIGELETVEFGDREPADCGVLCGCNIDDLAARLRPPRSRCRDLSLVSAE